MSDFDYAAVYVIFIACKKNAFSENEKKNKKNACTNFVQHICIQKDVCFCINDLGQKTTIFHLIN